MTFTINISVHGIECFFFLSNLNFYTKTYQLTVFLSRFEVDQVLTFKRGKRKNCDIERDVVHMTNYPQIENDWKNKIDCIRIHHIHVYDVYIAIAAITTDELWWTVKCSEMDNILVNG